MPVKILIIYNSVSFFSKLIKKKGYSIFPTFRSVNFLGKVFRRISIMLNVRVSFWYDDWKRHAESVDVILVFASRKYDHIEYLAKKYPLKRIIVWYWNPVFRCFNPNDLNYKNIEYWSFDLEDCKKYTLKYNTTFYFDNIDFSKNVPISSDVVFLGKDKGRSEKLKEIENELEEMGLLTNFYIVSDLSKGHENPKKFIAYESYLKMIIESRAILDYLQDGQIGLTLRPMESVFLNKKLITNDLNVINEDFYYKENVFILGKDNINDLKKFIEDPFVEVPWSIVSKYEFSNWINRFFTNE